MEKTGNNGCLQCFADKNAVTSSRLIIVFSVLTKRKKKPEFWKWINKWNTCFAKNPFWYFCIFNFRLHLNFSRFYFSSNAIRTIPVSSLAKTCLWTVSLLLPKYDYQALFATPALRDTVIKYNLVCALDFFPVTARRPPHPHSPESQTSPSFPHKLYFQSFWNAVPRFDAQQQARPFFFFFFFFFMTERVTDVQMFPSLICLRHVRLKWSAPVSMPVSKTQRILKTHSQPFILCCWNNNVSRDPPSTPLAWTSERICGLHLHDLPHFSIWDRRLHHLTSSKQLKGFIAWRVRALPWRTAVTRGCYVK